MTVRKARRPARKIRAANLRRSRWAGRRMRDRYTTVRSAPTHRNDLRCVVSVRLLRRIEDPSAVLSAGWTCGRLLAGWAVRRNVWGHRFAAAGQRDLPATT